MATMSPGRGEVTGAGRWPYGERGPPVLGSKDTLRRRNRERNANGSSKHAWRTADETSAPGDYAQRCRPFSPAMTHFGDSLSAVVGVRHTMLDASEEMLGVAHAHANGDRSSAPISSAGSA